MQYRAIFTRALGRQEYASEWFDTTEGALDFFTEFDGVLFFRRIVNSNGDVV